MSQNFMELAASRPLSEIMTPEEAALIAASVEIDIQAIRRPYFHIRPLDDPELENWHNYLDFIEKGDDFNKVVKLYERCMIACANYCEYWIRYVLCMEASGSMGSLPMLLLGLLKFLSSLHWVLQNERLVDGCVYFSGGNFSKQPEIHLFAARFKELGGDILGARSEFELLYSEITPGLLEAIQRHVNMEYRLKFLMATDASEFKEVAGNAEKARNALSEVLDSALLSKPLLEAAIHLETILPLPKRIEYLDMLVEKFITPNADNSMANPIDREDVSCIFFGDKTKMVKSVPSPGQSVMGAYPDSQNQWPADYGQKFLHGHKEIPKLKDSHGIQATPHRPTVHTVMQAMRLIRSLYPQHLLHMLPILQIIQLRHIHSKVMHSQLQQYLSRQQLLHSHTMIFEVME
ncbi:hypothetical protein HPP92_027334 [Vanilla planifolia]|uniref:Pre-mRNA-processing factor 39 n=1 Tax=Vanilla planifolia TaxID=51239 RepID=A0A835U7V6_VANPL|nr:hypothetical protein HPP92_027334 [Vanilla planifolia]